MTVRDHVLFLQADDQSSFSMTLSLDTADLHTRARRNGLTATVLLAREIRAQAGRHYVVQATDHEIEMIAMSLLEQRMNRDQPLRVTKLSANGGIGAEIERQLADLRQKLKNALEGYHHERGERKREHDQYERELADTRATLQHVQFTFRQQQGHVEQLKGKLDALNQTERQLQEAQRQLELLANERDALRDRVERLIENVNELRTDRDALADRLRLLEQAHVVLQQQAQTLQQSAILLDRLSRQAAIELLRVERERGQPLSLSTEMRTFIKKIQDEGTYGQNF